MIQVNAIVVKNVKLNTRFKIPLILSFVGPLVSIFLPLIVFGQIFSFSTNFGPWNRTNFMVFTFIAWHLSIATSVMNAFPSQLRTEKYWQTLPALLIAPFKRINLLIGIFITYFITSSISFTLFFVLCYIFYPISFLTVIFIIFLYFLIALIFSGVGLFLGVLSISRENLLPLFKYFINVIWMFSCIGLPFQFFPEFYQNIVLFNPLFYIIDFCRLVWIENNIIYSIITHPFNLLLLVSLLCTLPFMGYYLFEYIFKKYGIVGY